MKTCSRPECDKEIEDHRQYCSVKCYRKHRNNNNVLFGKRREETLADKYARIDYKVYEELEI